ncbi:MAG: four helix bundle protein [Flammeovirgaceae bacterium]|nr:MAG: four helix bundle protein [Flammeovirgaceae bacterium]
MAFKFERLKVWQMAIDLSGEIHELTKKFPKKELFVLTSQIQRASDSVALNIAEGSTGQSNPEFRRFLSIALRSAIEVVCCFYLAKRRKLVDDSEFNYFYDKLTELIKGIQALKNSIK